LDQSSFSENFTNAYEIHEAFDRLIRRGSSAAVSLTEVTEELRSKQPGFQLTSDLTDMIREAAIDAQVVLVD